MAVTEQQATPLDALGRLRPGQPLLFRGLDWEMFDATLPAAAGCRLRLVPDRGTLEVLSPLSIHEIFKFWFGYLLTVLTVELGLCVQARGSKTICRRDVDQGVKPDICFSPSNAPRVPEGRTFDRAIDLPPDLVVEADVTRNSPDRLTVYEVLRIPEVWRFFGGQLFVCCLDAQDRYDTAARSRVLPFLPVAAMVPLPHRCLALAAVGEVLREPAFLGSPPSAAALVGR